MKVVYKKEKSIIEQIDEAIINASMYNKKIDKIVLTKEEFERVGNQLFSVDDYTYAYKNITIELDEAEREDNSEDDDIDLNIISFGDTLKIRTPVFKTERFTNEREDNSKDDIDLTINSSGDTLSNLNTVVDKMSYECKKKEGADNDDFVESLLKIYEMLGLLPPKESK